MSSNHKPIRSFADWAKRHKLKTWSVAGLPTRPPRRGPRFRQHEYEIVFRDGWHLSFRVPAPTPLRDIMRAIVRFRALGQRRRD